MHLEVEIWAQVCMLVSEFHCSQDRRVDGDREHRCVCVWVSIHILKTY